MPIGRPRNTPGHAEAHQYVCRANTFDEEKQRAIICGADVPPGELTYLAHNSRSGAFLALCVHHRQALAETVDDWFSAEVGVGRLLASYTELPDGRLVSQTELRELLLAAGEEISKNGPLTDRQVNKAVKLKLAADAG
ncbi:hypothetical protein ACFYP4_02510 [Streptomyces sp. NPDC005551]|uniref:hypothetical protein n=1 Tax=Streptomyces sp. NPDC005551 TaxID=3364725 RepID=UPI003686A45F